MDDAQPKLPVWQTVRDTYVLTWQNLPTFFSYAWPWLAALVVADGLINWSNFDIELKLREPTSQLSASETWRTMAAGFFSLPIGALLAVPWHRYILLQEAPCATASKLFDRRTLIYCAYSVAMPLLFAAVALPVGIVWGMLSTILPTKQANLSKMLEVVAFVTYALMLIPMARFSMMFPARAVDNPQPLAWTWPLTQGNGGRLASGLILTAAPSAVLIQLLVPDPSNGHSSLVYAAINILPELISMVAGMTIVTFLSLAYRFFEQQPQSEAKQ